MILFFKASWLAVFGLAASALFAQVPGMIGYQGRLSVNGTNFTGTAVFKFAIIATNDSGAVSLWSHDGTSEAGSEPAGDPVPLSVIRGVYSVNLGDTQAPGMLQSIPADVFRFPAVYLRTWVDDGVNGSRLLAPDRRIAAVGYALVADTALSTPATALPAGAMVVSQQAQDDSLASNGYRLTMTVPAASWVNGSASDAPSARYGHTAVWSGNAMLLWGGRIAAGTAVASGGRYDPSADAWTILSTVGAPAARYGHTAVWSGSEMLVWGGSGASLYLGTGGRFKPEPQGWTAITTNGAPVGREGHVAVWTGSRMLVWGGINAEGLLADGGLYDPVSNQWTAITAAAPPAARMNACAVWTGNSLIVWGGEGESGPLTDGAQLVFSNGNPVAWQPLGSANAPSARSGGSAVWTGSGMIVWGGRNGDLPLGDGAIYDPALDSWQTLDSSNAPAARFDQAMLWSGSELLVVAGANAAGSLAAGGAYDPVTRLWRVLGAGGNPVARGQAAAVWTGTEILIFGGVSGVQPVAALQRLSPQPAWYFYRKL